MRPKRTRAEESSLKYQIYQNDLLMTEIIRHVGKPKGRALLHRVNKRFYNLSKRTPYSRIFDTLKFTAEDKKPFSNKNSTFVTATYGDVPCRTLTLDCFLFGFEKTFGKYITNLTLHDFAKPLDDSCIYALAVAFPNLKVFNISNCEFKTSGSKFNHGKSVNLFSKVEVFRCMETPFGVDLLLHCLNLMNNLKQFHLNYPVFISDPQVASIRESLSSKAPLESIHVSLYSRTTELVTLSSCCRNFSVESEPGDWAAHVKNVDNLSKVIMDLSEVDDDFDFDRFHEDVGDVLVTNVEINNFLYSRDTFFLCRLFFQMCPLKEMTIRNLKCVEPRTSRATSPFAIMPHTLEKIVIIDCMMQNQDLTYLSMACRGMKKIYITNPKGMNSDELVLVLRNLKNLDTFATDLVFTANALQSLFTGLDGTRVKELEFLLPMKNPLGLRTLFYHYYEEVTVNRVNNNQSRILLRRPREKSNRYHYEFFKILFNVDQRNSKAANGAFFKELAASQLRLSQGGLKMHLPDGNGSIMHRGVAIRRRKKVERLQVSHTGSSYTSRSSKSKRNNRH